MSMNRKTYGLKEAAASSARAQYLRKKKQEIIDLFASDQPLSLHSILSSIGIEHHLVEYFCMPDRHEWRAIDSGEYLGHLDAAAGWRVLQKAMEGDLQ